MTTAHVAATVPLPPPVARPQDAQLRQDVRWLAATLGRVVGRLAGEDTFRAVEELRRACRARRLGVPGAPDLDALLARTRALPPETARLTARAFTVFFILINAAEQAHRVRRSRQDDLAAAQRGSVRWSLRRLREAGHGAEEVARALLTLDVRPVLTAHPTESARRTILDLQARLAEALLARAGAPGPPRRAIEGRPEGELERLWLAAMSPELGASLERDRQELPGVWEQNRRRNADEPLRLKVSFMRARVAADPPGYASPDELERDLKLVADSLDAVGAAHARRALVEPLLAQVRAHGFHGYRLDVREDAAVHTRALLDLTTAVGLGELDGEAIRRELAGRRPLHAPHVALTGPTDGTLQVFRVIRAIQDEIGVAAASTYIVSRTRSADDLLRVLLLAREGGLVDLSREPALSRIDIVPLFETLEDLEQAPLVVRSLLGDPIWQRHLAA